MNKVTKGALAAAAAGALLLGGVGTYALWEDEGTIAANSVETGHLNLSELDSTGWLYDNDPLTPYINSIVPGDTVTNTYTATVNAEGDNITGTLTLAGLQDINEGEIQVDIVAGDLVGVTAVEGQPGVYTFAKAGTHTLEVVATVTFLGTATGSADTTVNLSAVTLNLTQGLPATV